MNLALWHEIKTTIVNLGDMLPKVSLIRSELKFSTLIQTVDLKQFYVNESLYAFRAEMYFGHCQKTAATDFVGKLIVLQQNVFRYH